MLLPLPRPRLRKAQSSGGLRRAFRRVIEGLWGASPTLAKFVNEMSDGKFTIDPFAAGEIVPGLQVLDAVANGTVECGHTYGGYYIGKNPALIFDGSLPFGMTAAPAQCLVPLRRRQEADGRGL